MRRRGWGGRRNSGGRGALEKLRGLRSAGVREVVGLSLDGVPDWIEIGSGLFGGDRRVAVVASLRPGEDLIGWARAAVALSEPEVAPAEVVVAAPVHSSLVRALAADMAAAGVRVHLLSVAGLADPAEEIFDLEVLPGAAELLDAHSSVYERVASVLQGAAAVTSCGGLRPTSSGCALYLRGVLAARARREAEGVAVSIVVPDKRRLFVNDGNFPRWGVDLHEIVVQLAQDPRVGSARGEDAVDAAAADAGARVTARWIPCSPEGALFVDWIGIDAEGAAHAGVAREHVRLADAVALATAVHLIGAARERWAPGSRGAVRVVASARQVEPAAQQVLDVLRGSLASPPSAAPRREERAPARLFTEREPEPEPEREREQEREREREREPEREVASSFDAPEAPESSEERPFESGRERRGGRRRGRRRRRGRGPGDRSPSDGEGEAGTSAGENEGEGSAASFEGTDERDFEGEDGAEDRDRERDARSTGAGSGDAFAEREEEFAPNAGDLGADERAEDSEVESALEPVPEPEPEPEETPRELPRRRRQRATVVVRNDPDAILAGLVLARDRRTTASFRVVRQDDLIDYLKGPANDVSDAEDLLLVGFTAQPHAREILHIAELFRGRAQWFDHHAWPIEDLEALRNTLGSESVLIEEAANPLPLVNEVTERRSRFTDKLVDLSARRLSENDMARWGYRLVGLIQRMAAHPGEHRSAIGPVLAGKPAELPQLDGVYAAEARWVEENDPRLVCFGEYDLAVCEVPEELDAGEVGRRVRASTGARLSLATRHGDDLVLLGANEEKRPLNVTGLVDALGSVHPWAHARSSADRVGRVWIDERARHPERLDTLIGEIVRRRSALHG